MMNAATDAHEDGEVTTLSGRRLAVLETVHAPTVEQIEEMNTLRDFLRWRAAIEKSESGKQKADIQVAANAT